MPRTQRESGSFPRTPASEGAAVLAYLFSVRTHNGLKLDSILCSVKAKPIHIEHEWSLSLLLPSRGLTPLKSREQSVLATFLSAFHTPRASSTETNHIGEL